MRIALLGTHPDGIAAAGALAARGNELVAVLDGPAPAFAPGARTLHDLEEVLADPAIEMVVVAGGETVRAEQLRRSVQSERIVLCVHPCAEKPDAGYQAAAIQAETKCVLVPLLPDGLHPAYARLREVSGTIRVLSVERRGPTDAPLFPEWDVLRRLGGEIAEVAGFASSEEWETARPLLIHGRFEKSGLFRVALLPGLGETCNKIAVMGSLAEAELIGPQADGAARLRWRQPGGDWQENDWHGWDRWAAFAEVVESALRKPFQPSAVGWQDAVRGLELDDALRRSVEKRRASALDLQEFSEETGSKGTLTLIGCGMLWLILVVFGMSILLPWIRWAIIPMLFGFLGLLALKWLGAKKA